MKIGDELISTTWVNGVKNGNGIIADSLGKKREVIYYNDVEFQPSEKNFYYIDALLSLGSVILTLILILSLLYFGSSRHLIEATGASYGLIFVTSFISKTKAFLSNITKGSDIFNEINTLKEKPPVVTYKI